MPSSEAIVLPTTVRPKKYRLRLQPDFGNFTFQGEETVDVEVVESTAEIVLNAADLKIASAVLHRDGGSSTATNIALDSSRQTATLTFAEPIPAGDASLEISFTGELNDKLHGFYRSEYTDADGETRYLATTQFEATDARRAFPCWDEPAQKASFDLTLVIPSDLVAVSNNPVVEEVAVDGGLKSLRFGETPVMSTYLLAFVIGDLV
ncbi:MAG: M1 family peptidase, partial [Chloroflexi bacterium]|nr:M1 family peptidase [Chloroflexota bacterium]